MPASARQGDRGSRPALFWVRLVVGLAILAFILGRIDLGAATVRPTALLLVTVLAGATLLVLSQAVAAMRWKTVLGDDLLPWGYLWRLYTIGSFFGLFLPTSVGGDAVRALAAARSSQRSGRAMASVLIDRGSGILASLAYASLGLILAPRAMAVLDGATVSWHWPGYIGAGLLLVAVGTVVLVFRRSRRARALWHQGLATVVELAKSPRRLATVAALALASQGILILLWYLLARGVHFMLPASTFLWAVPLVSLCALLPVTFAGLGVREGVWLVLLSGSGIPPADVVAFSLLYFVCTLLVGISGGFLFVMSGMTIAPADGARAATSP